MVNEDEIVRHDSVDYNRMISIDQKKRVSDSRGDKDASRSTERSTKSTSSQTKNGLDIQ